MYSRVTLTSHIMIPKAEIENISALRDQYTVVSRYKNGPTISYYKETENYFGVPRHAVRLSKSLAETIIDKRAKGVPIDLVFKQELWDYQQKAINEFSTLLIKGATGFFLEAAPGSGKTVMGLKMLECINRTTLVVVPKTDLLKQWKERILQFTNISEDDIGFVENGKANYKGKKIVIGLIHSIVLDRISTPAFCNFFGVVLFDECDSSLPPTTFSAATGLFPAKFRIGMTGTSQRADGLHVVFESHLAQYKILCNNTNTMDPRVIVHKFKESSGSLPSYLKDLSRRGVLISKLTDNAIRNNLIANYIIRSFNSGRSTLVISDRKEQLKKIKQILIKVHKIDSKYIGFYVRSLDGRMLKQEEKDKTASKSPIILATYGLLGRGTDIPRLETLIFASPRGDARQVLGRIERAMEGKKQPVVIDIVDTFYPECIRSYKTRLKYYESRGLRIKELK